MCTLQLLGLRAIWAWCYSRHDRWIGSSKNWLWCLQMVENWGPKGLRVENLWTVVSCCKQAPSIQHMQAEDQVMEELLLMFLTRQVYQQQISSISLVCKSLFLLHF
jgi:hypothetical protein